MTKLTSKTTYTYAVGRRRAAVVSVKLFKGKGESTVNTSKVTEYFPSDSNKVVYSRPFNTVGMLDKYYFQAKAVGGGKNGQLSALTLAISRAFKKIDETYGPMLRTVGLLTVDSRVRERRMVGTGGKARRQKQSPKR